MNKFDLKKFNDVKVKEEYQVEIPNRFAALESLEESFDISNAWESIGENINTSAKHNLGYQELKHNKPWSNDKCSKLTDHQKQAQLQWLQNPNHINGDNLQNLRCETSRIFTNKKKEYLKGKINELETNNKNQNIRDFYRDINEFKKNGNLLADPQKVLNR
jgi:hypothetical protein